MADGNLHRKFCMKIISFCGILVFSLLLGCNDEDNPSSFSVNKTPSADDLKRLEHEITRWNFTGSVHEKTPFEGTWEHRSVSNKVHLWKFTGHTYEEYDEVGDESGEHYYKGVFTYEEILPRYGLFKYQQTHSAIVSGAWTPDAEEAAVLEITRYKFVDSTTLEISSAEYRKKSSLNNPHHIDP